MPIAPVATASAPAQAAAPTRAPKQEMDGELFMQLLIVQLQNQDPSSPMDTNEMIAQTNQLAMMEQLTAINSGQQETFGLAMRSAAAALLDTTVSYTDAETGEEVTGTVTAVSYAGAVPVVTVAGTDIPLDQVSAVVAAAGA